MDSLSVRRNQRFTATLFVSLLIIGCNTDDPDPLFDAGMDRGMDKGIDAASSDSKTPVLDSSADGRIEPAWGCPFPYTSPQKRDLPGNDAGISMGPTSATDVHVRCRIDLEGTQVEVLVKAIPVEMGAFSATFEAQEAYLCRDGAVEPLTDFSFVGGGRHNWMQMGVTFDGRRYTFGYSEVCVGNRPCTPYFDQYDVFDAADDTELATARPAICAGVGPGGVPHPLVPQMRIQTGDEADVSVPFSMGSNDGDPDEQPVHEINVLPMRVDRHEATNEEFALFLSDHGNDCEGHDCVKTTGAGFQIKEDGALWRAEEGFADHPVVQVTWYGAEAYCVWRHMRLPNELFWEAAASSVGQRRYPWGEDAPSCDLALFDQCAKTAPDLPCSHPLGNSQEGICDLSGNLAEWIRDWYQSDFYEICSTSDFSNCSQGPSTPTGLKAVRGGSFAQPAENLRAADRNSADPQTGADHIGVRCFSGNPS